MCNSNYVSEKAGGICDSFIINKCAKELYDAGCLKIKKNKKGRNVRVWNAKNRNCFDRTGNLIYGSEECACINSATGFTLNTDPSNKIKGGVAFENRDQNPYGLDGTGQNGYTKYSLNVFGYDPQYQKPQLFDSRCASRVDAPSNLAGENAPYMLPSYSQKGLTICMNQINIKDSDIGSANFKNIKQNNNCGGPGKSAKPLKVEENPKERDARISKEKEVSRREAERLEKAAAEKAAAEKAAKEKAKKEKIKKIKKEAEAKKKLKEKEEELKKIKKKAKIDKIKSAAKEKKAAKKHKKELIKKEIIIKANAKKEIKAAQEEATYAKDKKDKAAQEKNNELKKNKNRNMYIAIGVGVIIVLILGIVLMGERTNEPEETYEYDEE